MADQDRLNTLDALRGIAAIMVMAYHTGAVSPLPAASGYLAVDFFFALSGFVLARAYQHRLRGGLPVAQFALQRLIRVYPMVLASGLLALAIGHGSLGALLLLPDLQSPGLLYPSNTPLWSLACELAVNLAFAVLSVRLGWKALAAILVASGAVLAHGALGPGGTINAGGFWSDWHIGLVRTVFSFTLGVAIFRLHELKGYRLRTTALAWLLFPLLAGALMAAPAWRGGWEALCLFAILPAVLWFGAQWNCPASPLAKWLGDISYPLYCIHALFVFNPNRTPVQAAVLFALLMLAAWAFDRFYDRPVRALLASALKRRAFRRPAPA